MRCLKLKFQFYTHWQFPRKIGVLGYGAIGRSTIEIILENHPDACIVALDQNQLDREENRFKYINHQVTKQNLGGLLQTMGLQRGDFFIDLSTGVAFLDIWPLCFQNGIRYLNTALERWEDSESQISYPKNVEEQQKCSLRHLWNQAKKRTCYNEEIVTLIYLHNKGPTAIFISGMNPGLISHFAKRAIQDAGKYYLENAQQTIDIDMIRLKEILKDGNHSKIAQCLGIHTIHCSEFDDQVCEQTKPNVEQKFHNTWSCTGFLAEGLVPFQIGKGSHEDSQFSEYSVMDEGKSIMSFKPSVQSWAKSWVPTQNIQGVLIPHSEAISLTEYLFDKETNYQPSQYYVYDFNPYAKKFIRKLGKGATLQNTKPDSVVMHPSQFPDLKGVDKIGALVLMKNNRAWWTGSIMDNEDSKKILQGQFGPTVLQVAAGVYGAFIWGCMNPNAGCRWPEQIDTNIVLEKSLPYIGQFMSVPVDLNKTTLQDCYKFQSFLIDDPSPAQS